MNILNEIVEKTRKRVLELDFKTLKSVAEKLPAGSFEFERALNFDNKIKIIAEIKKASPSKGIIAQNFDPAQIAVEYKNANVDCISVLTEPFFFMGDNSYIKTVKNASNKPILRKDFIINPAQIYESKILGADCVLLICTILNFDELFEYIKIADKLGLSALVETRCEEEIKMALSAGARIIGVNNRNLKNFEVDLNHSLKLRKFVPDNVIFVSESGIKTRTDVQKLEQAGVCALLIGETFMRAVNKIEVIKKLKGEV